MWEAGAREGGKFASGLRKAWDRRMGHSQQQHSQGQGSSHGAELAARQAESDITVRLGLAAFAIAAYVKMVLCPSLSSYIPRTGSGFSALGREVRRAKPPLPPPPTPPSLSFTHCGAMLGAKSAVGD